MDKDLKQQHELITSFKYAPAKAVQAIDRLIKLKNTKSHWVVIKEIVRMWAEERPTEYKSFIITLKDTQATRKKKAGLWGKEYKGISYDTKGSRLVDMVDIPVRVMKMIRAIYKPDQLPMDKKFFNGFIKRFPKFKIGGKA
jgi:hypothetical protein